MAEAVAVQCLSVPRSGLRVWWFTCDVHDFWASQEGKTLPDTHYSQRYSPPCALEGKWWNHHHRFRAISLLRPVQVTWYSTLRGCKCRGDIEMSVYPSHPVCLFLSSLVSFSPFPFPILVSRVYRVRLRLRFRCPISHREWCSCSALQHPRATTATTRTGSSPLRSHCHFLGLRWVAVPSNYGRFTTHASCTSTSPSISPSVIPSLFYFPFASHPSMPPAPPPPPPTLPALEGDAASRGLARSPPRQRLRPELFCYSSSVSLRLVLHYTVHEGTTLTYCAGLGDCYQTLDRTV